MATVAPPVRNDISGTAPNPSNAVARAAFGALHDYLMNLLGSAGSPVAARTALGIPDGIGKNKLINANFAVNQRAVTGTVVLTAGTYGHDRFKAGAGGCTYTFATALNKTTFTISAGTLMQVIEGKNLFSGTHTASHVGTAQVRIDGGAYGASGTTGTAVGGTNQTIEWGVGTLSQVQYEQGAFATAFEQKLYETTFLECRDYFRFIALSAFLPASAFSTNKVVAGIQFDRPMRAAPTASCGGTAFTYFYNNAAVASSVVALTINTYGINIDATVTATVTTCGVGTIANLSISAEI
jgi:hypothetical protein